jgi:hypothetical protein
MQNNRNINTYEIDSIKKIKTISCKARHIRNTISYACKCFWKKNKSFKRMNLLCWPNLLVKGGDVAWVCWSKMMLNIMYECCKISVSRVLMKTLKKIQGEKNLILVETLICKKREK